jgi:maltose alpha-D-glucosyltransferase/alpha-amylase
MHAALTDEKAGPDFAPEKFNDDYARHLYGDMIDQADATFGLLDDKKNMLSGEAAESAKKLLGLQAGVRDRFASLRQAGLKAVRIRHHGDYHLGQVLATGDDFIIIDFEGEPARPLAHRRIKTLAMRDVAGMVRSFSYAGYAALFGLVPGVTVSDEKREQVEGWAAFWGAWVSAEYLKTYFETAAGAPFVGADPKEHRLLFDAFMLQKALYEVAYELNNRPGWVQIPLRGILDLIA